MTDQKPSGISNRQPPEVEEEERHRLAPMQTESPPPEDAGGDVGDPPVETVPERQTSHKAGSRSIAQKEAASKYADRSMPQTHGVSGAFGKEGGT
jgi:hypothetical protein